MTHSEITKRAGELSRLADEEKNATRAKLMTRLISVYFDLNYHQREYREAVEALEIAATKALQRLDANGMPDYFLVINEVEDARRKVNQDLEIVQLLERVL